MCVYCDPWLCLYVTIPYGKQVATFSSKVIQFHNIFIVDVNIESKLREAITLNMINAVSWMTLRAVSDLIIIKFESLVTSNRGRGGYRSNVTRLYFHSLDVGMDFIAFKVLKPVLCRIFISWVFI